MFQQSKYHWHSPNDELPSTVITMDKNMCQGSGSKEDNEMFFDHESILTRTNPFLSTSQDLGPNEVNSLRAGNPESSGLFTRISDTSGEIVKLNLMKTDLYPGENIFGILDFRDSIVTCTQYCISLTSEEEKKNPGKQAIHSTFSEVCLGFDTSSFQLPVPHHVNQSSEGAIKCFLNFEFVLATKKFYQEMNKTGTSWKAPSKVFVKTRRWQTPLNIAKNRL